MDLSAKSYVRPVYLPRSAMKILQRRIGGPFNRRSVRVYITTRALGLRASSRSLFVSDPYNADEYFGSQVYIQSDSINAIVQTSGQDLEVRVLCIDHQSLNTMPSISPIFGNDIRPILTGKSFVICLSLLVCHCPR